MRAFILYSFLELCLISSSAFARTYYLGPSGSDNADGSISAPWGTLGKANTAMAAGDTLYMRGGTYSGFANIHYSIYVYNNTFYLDGSGATECYGIQQNCLDCPGEGTLTAKNNIFYFVNWSIGDAVSTRGTNIYDYNLYYPAKDTDDNGTHSLSGDPLFANTGAADLHIASLSPVRGKGETITLFHDDFDGNNRPMGSYDIFERGGRVYNPFLYKRTSFHRFLSLHWINSSEALRL